MVVTVEYENIELDLTIDFTPYKEQTMIDPEVTEEYYVVSVMHNSEDIIELLDDEMLGALANLSRKD